MKLAMHLALLAALALMAGACGGGGGGGGDAGDGGDRAGVPGESGGGGSSAGSSASGGSDSSAADPVSEEEGNPGGAPTQTPNAPSDHSYLASMLLSAPNAPLDGFLEHARVGSEFSGPGVSVRSSLPALLDELNQRLRGRSGILGGGANLFDPNQGVLVDLHQQAEGAGLAEQEMQREMLEWVLEIVVAERRAFEAQAMLAVLQDAVSRSALSADPGLGQGMQEAAQTIYGIHLLIRASIEAAIADRSFGAGHGGEVALPEKLPPTPHQASSMLSLQAQVFQSLLELRAQVGEPAARALVVAFYDYVLGALAGTPADVNGSAAQLAQMRQVLDGIRTLPDPAQDVPSDPGQPQEEQLQIQVRSAPDGELGAVLLTVSPARAVSWFADPMTGIDMAHRDDGILLRVVDGGPARTVRVTAVALDGPRAELDVRVGIEAPVETGRHAGGQVVDAATGNPIDEALVEIRDLESGAIREMVTDATGRFSFEHLSLGNLEIVVHAHKMQMEEGLILEEVGPSGSGNSNSDDIQVRMISVD